MYKRSNTAGAVVISLFFRVHLNRGGDSHSDWLMAEGDRMTSRVYCPAGIQLTSAWKAKKKSNKILRLWGLIRLGSITIRYGRLQSLAITLLIIYLTQAQLLQISFFLYIQPEQWASARRGSFLFKNGIQQKEKVHKLGVEFLIADGRPQ